LGQDVVHVRPGADFAGQLSLGNPDDSVSRGYRPLIYQARQFNLKMPRRPKGAQGPNYTKVFSNLANPFLEVEFFHDDRDPIEELKELATYPSYRHVVQDFDFGLQDIIET